MTDREKVEIFITGMLQTLSNLNRIFPDAIVDHLGTTTLLTARDLFNDEEQLKRHVKTIDINRELVLMAMKVLEDVDDEEQSPIIRQINSLLDERKL